MKRNVVQLSLLVLIAAAMMLGSCLPASKDDNMIITFRDPGVDYTLNKKYALPDSVVMIGNQSGSSTVSATYAQLIITKIAENMNTLGYQRTADPDSADITILPSVIYSSSEYDVSSTYSLDPYWGWYDPDWIGPDFDWGVDFGWYSDEIFTFSTGTLFIQMIDKKNPNLNDKKYSSIWAALINGALTLSNVQANLVTDINQAFAQSEYLKIN